MAFSWGGGLLQLSAHPGSSAPREPKHILVNGSGSSAKSLSARRQRTLSARPVSYPLSLRTGRGRCSACTCVAPLRTRRRPFAGHGGGDFIWSEVKARSRDFLGSDSSDRVGQKVVTARRGGGRTFSPASPSLPFILVWSRLIDVFLESPKVAAF